MITKTILSIFACAIILFSLSSYRSITTNENKLFPGDTASFKANLQRGWTIISSYLSQETPDSVEFEMILNQSSKKDWHAEQLIGTITNSLFLPKQNQKLTYNLLIDNQWELVITINGDCYLHKTQGPSLVASSLDGNTFVLPIKVRYKNS
jgi:hypothetical protein